MGISRTAAEVLKEKREKESADIDARIRRAFITIREDKTMKPTFVNIAKLADCHTDTLKSRDWCNTEIKIIKDRVKAEKKVNTIEANQKKQEKRNDLVNYNEVVTDELLYWFDKCMALKTQNKALENERNMYRNSSDTNKDAAKKYSEQLKMAVCYMSEIHNIDLEQVIDYSQK